MGKYFPLRLRSFAGKIVMIISFIELGRASFSIYSLNRLDSNSVVVPPI